MAAGPSGSNSHVEAMRRVVSSTISGVVRSTPAGNDFGGSEYRGGLCVGDAASVPAASADCDGISGGGGVPHTNGRGGRVPAETGDRRAGTASRARHGCASWSDSEDNPPNTLTRRYLGSILAACLSLPLEKAGRDEVGRTRRVSVVRTATYISHLPSPICPGGIGDRVGCGPGGRTAAVGHAGPAGPPAAAGSRGYGAQPDFSIRPHGRADSRASPGE